MNKTVITVLVIIAAAVLVALTISSKPTAPEVTEAPITPAAEAPAPVTDPAAEGQSLGEKTLQESGQSTEGFPDTAPKAPEGAPTDVVVPAQEGAAAPADVPAAPAEGQQ